MIMGMATYRTFGIKVLVLLLVVSIGIIGIPQSSYALTIDDHKEDNLKAFLEVYDLLSEYHISGIDQESLAQAAINGMIEATEDPYTSYFSEEELNNFEESIDGSFVGIGIIVSSLISSDTAQNETLNTDFFIDEVLPNSPAEQAGLIVTDQLIQVDDIKLDGMSIDDVQSLIIGDEDSYVSLKVLRNDQVLTFKVSRTPIHLPAIEAEMLTKDIGYIRLFTFSIESGEEFNKALEELKKQGMNKLVLDLRGNPGGYLDAAIDISSNFIEHGPIAIMRDKAGREEELTFEGGKDWSNPMVVLIDRDSASASEILAGALQDYEKATIIGETSYGKGTVQSLIPLNAGGYLKITIDDYVTPLHQTINGVGVEPDIEIAYNLDQIPTAIYTLTDEDLFVAVHGIEWIQENSKEYLVLRPIIEFFGGEVEWNSVNKSVEVILDNQKQNFSNLKYNGLIVKNGTTYIELDKLKQAFPILKIKHNLSKKFITVIHP